MKLSYYIAIIDEADDFVTRLELAATKKIRGLGCEVKGFTSVDKFKKAVTSLKNEIPVLAIADSASYYPNVEEGPFVFLKKEVPIANGIVFTTDQTRKEWQRFIDMRIVKGKNNIIKRQDDIQLKSILDVIISNVNEIMTSNPINAAIQLAEKLPADPNESELEMIHNIATGKNQVSIDCTTCRGFKTNEEEMRKTNIDRTQDRGMTEEANKYDAGIYNLLISGAFGKYIKKGKLNIFQKFIFKDLVRYRLNYLSKNQEMKKKLREFFENDKYKNNSDAWRIYKSVYMDLSF